MHEFKRPSTRFFRRFCTLAVIFALSFLLVSVAYAQTGTSDDANTTATEPQTLTIFAASSLTDVMQALGDAFSAQYNAEAPPEINYNFASSSTLAVQLQQGATAGVFASANLIQMQNVVEDDLINTEVVTTFATNELVIIVPEDNPGAVDTAANLSRLGITLVLAAPGVPVREYTDELLRELDRDFGMMFSERVLRNLVSEEDNVRRVVAKIALGEADVGIVYRTDVTPDVIEDIRVIPLPAGVSPQAEYPIAPLQDAQTPDLAQAFIDFVLSDAGADILAEWDFGIPEPEADAEGATEAEATPSSDE